MNRIFALLGTGLSLVALYLVLTNSFAATQIFTSLARGTSEVYRTLQGR